MEKMTIQKPHGETNAAEWIKALDSQQNH